MRIRMRYRTVFALAAVAAMTLVGIALAAANGNSSSLTGSKFSPSTLPKDTYKAGSLFVHTHTNYAHPGSTLQGGITKHAKLFFDDDGKLNTTGIPTCDKNNISGNIDMATAMARCGTAKVGSGKAAAILIQAGTPHNINACVLLFNGKKTSSGQPTNLVFTRAQASVPSSIDCSNPAGNHHGNTTVLLEGIIKPNPTSLGPDFDGGKMVDYDHIDQASPFPLTDFQVNVKRGSFISARCHDADHRLNFKGTFIYSDNQSDTVSTSQTCTVG